MFYPFVLSSYALLVCYWAERYHIRLDAARPSSAKGAFGLRNGTVVRTYFAFNAVRCGRGTAMGRSRDGISR